MSNFICSECGTSQIDCGSEGYKTPREIELEDFIKWMLKQQYYILPSGLKNKCRKVLGELK